MNTIEDLEFGCIGQPTPEPQPIEGQKKESQAAVKRLSADHFHEHALYWNDGMDNVIGVIAENVSSVFQDFDGRSLKDVLGDRAFVIRRSHPNLKSRHRATS